MMNRFFGPFVGGRPAVGLLILRLVFGLGIMLHGYQKVSSHAGAFHWGDKLGIPSVFQGLATLCEFGGGLALMLGLLVPLAALGLTITMLVAIFTVHLPHGARYVNLSGGPDYEAAAHYLTFALTVLITGPGALSLDALLFGRRVSETAYVSGGARVER